MGKKLFFSVPFCPVPTAQVPEHVCCRRLVLGHWKPKIKETSWAKRCQFENVMTFGASQTSFVLALHMWRFIARKPTFLKWQRIAQTLLLLFSTAIHTPFTDSKWIADTVPQLSLGERKNHIKTTFQKYSHALQKWVIEAEFGPALHEWSRKPSPAALLSGCWFGFSEPFYRHLHVESQKRWQDAECYAQPQRAV